MPGTYAPRQVPSLAQRKRNALHSSVALQTCIRHIPFDVSPVAGVSWGTYRLMAPSTAVPCTMMLWKAYL